VKEDSLLQSKNESKTIKLVTIITKKKLDSKIEYFFHKSWYMISF